MYNRSVFIFRRSFRLKDNIGLINCLKESEEVIPIFIFTPEQIKKNRYKSNNAVQFMIESLVYLNKLLKKKKSRLFIFYTLYMGFSINIYSLLKSITYLTKDFF